MRLLGFEIVIDSLQITSDNIDKCFSTGAKVFAAIIPEAATAGKPIPGNVESPQHIKPPIPLPIVITPLDNALHHHNQVFPDAV